MMNQRDIEQFLLVFMGNSNESSFESRDWVHDRRSHNFDVFHDGRGTYAEKHIIPNNPKVQPKDEMEIYNYRHDTDKPIVRVYDAEYTKSTSMCKAEPSIEVYTEFIPYRLSDTRNLNNGQALYVLSEALAGFHELFYRFGSFPITDDHIGFNDQGDVKVWLSPNFANNHLPHDGIILMSTQNPRNFDEKFLKRQEEEMVEDVWLAVADHALIDNDFQQRANNFREMNFVEARRLVADEIERRTCYVPEFLNFEGSNRLGHMIDSREYKNSSGSYTSNEYPSHQDGVYQGNNNNYNYPPNYANAPNQQYFGNNGYQGNNFQGNNNYQYQDNIGYKQPPPQGGYQSGVQPYQEGNFNPRYNQYPPAGRP